MKPPNVCYAIKGNYIDRDTKQNGKGWSDDGMYTLDATDRHGVCYPSKARALIERSGSEPCVDRGQNIVCVLASTCENAEMTETTPTETPQAATGANQ